MTPTTMTTSMITTATTMITDVVVAPLLGGLVVGCMLLLTGTVVVMGVAPSLGRLVVGCVVLVTGAVETGTVSVAVNAPTVCVTSSGIDAVVRKWATVFYS